jgi:putative phosphoesterase
VRIVVTGDTHVSPQRPRRLPEPLLAACSGADMILHAGDVMHEGVLQELAAYAPVAAVLGNMDGWDLVDRIPERRVVEAGGVRIGMVHDSGQTAGRAGRLRAAFPGCRVVVFGHSHLPVCEWDRDLLLLNPGSPTERRRAPYHSYAELTVTPDGEVEAYIIPIEKDQR